MTSFIQNIILAAVAFACLMAIIAMWTTDTKKGEKPSKHEKPVKGSYKKIPNILLPGNLMTGTRMTPVFILDIFNNDEQKHFDLTSATKDLTIERFKEGDNDLKSIKINDEFLSAPHLIFYQKNGEYKVSDCGSLNGTQILDNGKLVKLVNGHSLKDNDTIVLSKNTKIVVHEYGKPFYPPFPKKKIDVDQFKV